MADSTEEERSQTKQPLDNRTFVVFAIITWAFFFFNLISSFSFIFIQIYLKMYMLSCQLQYFLQFEVLAFSVVHATLPFHENFPIFPNPY